MHLLLLPGRDGSGDLFDPLRAALGDRADVRIARYRDEVELDDYVQTVRGMLPARGGVVLAESFSGLVALALMAREPERLCCAVLCAAFAVSPFRGLARLAPLLPAFSGSVRLVHRALLRRFGLNGEAGATLLDAATAALATNHGSRLRSRVALCGRTDLRPQLARITSPILYLRASRDRIVRRASSEDVIRGLPRCTVRDVDGPHLLLQTRPRECADVVVSFALAADCGS